MRTGFCVLVAAAFGAAAARGQQVPAAAWQAGAEALKARPGLVRFYALTDAGRAHADGAGTAAELRYRPAGQAALTTEVGRVAGHLAVVLDADSFEAPAPALTNAALTVSVWIRPLGAGSKTGNAGSANGTIAACGSGYYDGWRLVVGDWKSRLPSLELGRPQGSFSVCASDGLSAGFWNHLAATWDGARVRLYVNGMLSAEKAYDGAPFAPKGALRLGYAGNGIGALRMAADELAVFDRALAPEEVAGLSLVGAPLPEALRPLVAQAASASGGASACAAYRAVAAAPGAPPAWKAWAELAALRASGARRGELAAACSALFENAAVPAQLRGQAVERLARVCREGGGGELPSRVLEKLPEYLELDAESQRMFGLALGASCAREGRLEEARRIYGQLLSAGDASPQESAEVRMLLAQALRQAGRWEEARGAYEAVAAEAKLPFARRGLAAVAAAQTRECAGRLSEAAAAYRAAAAFTNQVPHLAEEAEACAEACEKRLAGKPASDPEAHRERLAPLPEPGLAFFVAPSGDDANPGTLAKPFATLVRARDAIRLWRMGGHLPAGGAAVCVRGGRYAVTNTFVLTEEDSGDVGAPIVYRAWGNERPVFDGGFAVRGFGRVRDADALARLPPEARAEVRVADVRAQGFAALDAQKSYGYGLGNRTVCELFEDGAPLTVARWPNGSSLTIGEVVDLTNRVFACTSDRLSRWTRAPDLMACGYWYHLWAGCTVPVASVDPAAGTVTLKEKPGYGMAKGRPFYVLNLLEELDRPGEWYLDRAAGKLYVWPRRHTWFSAFVLSRWNRPFVEAKHVQNVIFQGLTFEYGQQDGVAFDECVNATVAGCVIRRMGGTALTMTHGANVRIYGNRLDALGHTGMHVSGGNRRNLTSGQIVIENNDVGDFGRCSRTYNPAVLLEGCGARVAHNHFHHAPSSALRVEGNDHVIEYNAVDHVVQESDDQGAVDMWGNPSYRGVVIRYNRWSDIGGGDIPCGQAGVRFDDAISGVLVYGNLFERCSNGRFGGVQIHGGQKNIVDNNLFVDCRYGVSFSPWGQKRWREYVARPSVRQQLLREVDIRLPPYITRYPELGGLMDQVDVNSVWRNVFVNSSEMFFHAPKELDAWANQAYAERPDTAALSAGTPFRPLPLDEIGPYADPDAARE